MLRIAAVTLMIVASTGHAQVVSSFKGSELQGEYQTDYTRLHYLAADGEDIGMAAAEGRLTSRIYKQPAGKENLEVFRSFENALTTGGFDLISVLEDARKVEIAAREANGPGGNGITARAYSLDGRPTGTSIKALVGTQAQQYIAARKTIDGTDLLVVISTSRSGNYLVEELASAAMEQGTVTLSLDAMRDALAQEGRIALYGIHFATGSAAIQTESSQTLATIVDYLAAHPQQHFYVVGHTDDQGALDANMTLSAARAKAVVDAIVEALPAAAALLVPRGVGPLSPLATNGADDGRALNRRVELVSTHE